MIISQIWKNFVVKVIARPNSPSDSLTKSIFVWTWSESTFVYYPSASTKSNTTSLSSNFTYFTVLSDDFKCVWFAWDTFSIKVLNIKLLLCDSLQVTVAKADVWVEYACRHYWGIQAVLKKNNTIKISWPVSFGNQAD